MKEEKTLGENLKSAREENHFSQEYVAKQLNISRQAISKWENGKGYPDLDNLVLLSKLYDVSIDALMKAENIPQRNVRASNVASDETNLLSGHIEEILLAVILSISCIFPPIGILVPIGILIWMKKKEKHYKIILIFCIFCILLNCYNSFAILNVFFFDIGEGSIEKISRYLLILNS